MHFADEAEKIAATEKAVKAQLELHADIERDVEAAKRFSLDAAGPVQFAEMRQQFIWQAEANGHLLRAAVNLLEIIKRQQKSIELQQDTIKSLMRDSVQRANVRHGYP
jgi:transcriptional antiterminator Rof (Rho-off)